METMHTILFAALFLVFNVFIVYMRFITTDAKLLAANGLLIAAFVIKRRGMNIFLAIEGFLHRWVPRFVVIPLRELNRAFTSAQEQRKQHIFMKSWDAVTVQYNELMQRELYLLDERRTLKEKRKLVGCLSPRYENALQTLEDGLAQIRPSLFLVGKEFQKLHSEIVGGSWTAERLAESNHRHWNRKRTECEAGLGCCARECKCCQKARRSYDGRFQVFQPDVKTHCTAECGCCIRWRGGALSQP